MKNLLKFKGKVEDGKFLPDEPQAFKDHVKTFNGKEVNVTFKKYRAYKERSNEQNRYYWGVCVKILADEWGYPKEEHDMVHKLIKAKLLMNVVEVKGGKRLMEVGDTSTLSTADFEKFLSSLRMWSTQEFNCFIPLPNEVPFEF